MPFGKYRGKTLDAIVACGDRAYIEWLARDSSDKRIKAAAASFLESIDSEQRLLHALTSTAANSELSPGAKLVFLVIFAVADQNPRRHCTISNAEIARRTALSEKHVKRSLDDLGGHGLIERVMRDAGHRAHIRVLAGGTICPQTLADTPTSRPPWQDHFDAARSEDIRKPIRGSIKRREDGAQSKDRDQAMDDYFWRKAPDRKQAKPGRFTPDDPPELRPQDYTPEDWAELQASTRVRPPWED
jgi:hypothetical protein